MFHFDDFDGYMIIYIYMYMYATKQNVQARCVAIEDFAKLRGGEQNDLLASWETNLFFYFLLGERLSGFH